MILKYDRVPAETAFACDICIVGAGVAGISLALELVGSRAAVILLESGNLGVDEATEALNDGEILADSFRGLRSGRRRGLGGTTSAWGGQCCELDIEDFETRSWVPNSGWPITYRDLEPYYRRAENIFGVSGHSYDEKNWTRLGVSPVKFGPNSLRTAFSIFAPHLRIGKKHRTRLADAPNLRVLLGATATNICTNAEGSLATAVEFKSLSGRSSRIAASAIILCNGTIETARLMLASRDICQHGIGNDRDNVGRYLQDHPTARTASLEPRYGPIMQTMYGVRYRGRTGYWPKVALSPERQRKQTSLNGSAWIHFTYESSALQSVRKIITSMRTKESRFDFSAQNAYNLIRDIPAVGDAAIRKYLLGQPSRAAVTDIRIQCSIEQSPDPNNRVTLSQSRDRLGMPRPAVSWRIGNLERHTFRVLTETIREEFIRLGYGPVNIESWLDDDMAAGLPVWDNYHQVGTARMSDDPSKGVVDRDGRVHGMAGLYVAGAPTFVTSGYANPVLTIAALSIRLGDHLKKALKFAEIGVVSPHTDSQNIADKVLN